VHGLYAQRNAAIPQSTIFPPILNTEQEIPGIPNVLTKETIKDHMHKWMLKGFDLIPVGKDDEGNHWPGFGPGVPHASDWRKAKQQGETPSMDDVRAFWREQNFDLRVACPKQRGKNLEIDSGNIEIDPCHCTIRDHGKTHLIEEMNQVNDQDRQILLDQRQVKGPRETKMDIDRNQNSNETRSELRDRGRGNFRGRNQNYQL
ncbi:MAG: hypothetical protein EZS28_025775, partial [Streblomastix strix]